jgi:sarcosine oxidase
MRVAVIGAGATGCASARFLANAGHEVHVFEQFEVGHSRGSSHGTSRIIRKSYPDPYYTALMSEAYPLWMELQDDIGTSIYSETGLLVIGREDAKYLRETRSSLSENRVPFETLGPIEVARRFHGFHLDPDEIAIFQPQAGVLRADRVIQETLRLACQAGANIHAPVRARVEPNGWVNGDQFEAIAICAGAWTTAITGLSLEPRLQHFAYFEAPVSPEMPVWVDSAEEHDYGFPNYGRGFKIGRHLYGKRIDPDAEDRSPDSSTLEAIFATARRRIGATAMLEAHTCVYTVAPNEDFRIGQLPWEVPAYFISGCSGHGFKFTVWFGKLMKDLIEGKRTPSDYPRFLEES